MKKSRIYYVIKIDDKFVRDLSLDIVTFTDDLKFAYVFLNVESASCVVNFIFSRYVGLSDSKFDIQMIDFV